MGIDRELYCSLLILLFLVTEVQLKECPRDEETGFMECVDLVVKDLLHPCHSCYYHTELDIPQNQTIFLKEEMEITANVSDYNSSYAPYTHVFCVSKFFQYFPFPWISYLGCVETNDSAASTRVTWRTSHTVTVHLFSYRNDSDEVFGYDNSTICITEDENLVVQINLTQHRMPNPLLFQTGYVNISVNTSRGGQDTAEVFGSGSNEQETIRYSYRLFYNDSSKPIHLESNESSLETTYNFSKEGKSLVAVEVICNVSSNGSSTIYFGNDTKHIHTYDPIREYNMKTIPDKTSSNNISVLVSASGSFPIVVTWKVLHIATNSGRSCNATNLTLTKESEYGRFHCHFNFTGQYQFKYQFKNIVSYRSGFFSFTIKGPSDTKEVVTTSTAVVVVVVLLIIAVVCAIVFVSGYISYRKYKNKSTETADFTFIDLQKPSRWRMVKIQFMHLKDKVSRKRRRRVGLVQPNEDSDVDSFYGSLNPFADHESL